MQETTSFGIMPLRQNAPVPPASSPTAYRRDRKGFRIQVNFLHVKIQGGHVGGGLSRGVKTGIQRVVKEE